MPRVSIWLPDDLHRLAKDLRLPVSELAQHAVAQAVERQRKGELLDAYLAELDAELGVATPEERDKAQALVARMQAPPSRRRASRSA